MTHITDHKAMMMATAVKQHVQAHDGFLINCVDKAGLAPDKAQILQAALGDANSARIIGPIKSGIS